MKILSYLINCLEIVRDLYRMKGEATCLNPNPIHPTVRGRIRYDRAMLTPPPLANEQIRARAAEAFGLELRQVTFLPLGADGNTAVYRAAASTGADYFLKLRKNTFDPINVTVPHCLHTLGIGSIIPPLAARSGLLWAELAEYALILYPFVPGQDGYELALTPAQWTGFGADLARVHAAQLPAALASRIPREAYAPLNRDKVRAYLTRVEGAAYADPVAARLAAFLADHRQVVSHMLARSEHLAGVLRANPLEFVLCHSDLHPGNLHLTPDGAFYLVDWDAPLYAPKERDLMLVGAASPWDDPQAAEIFYRAYAPLRGSACLDPQALAYYRYTRIIEDIAAYCEQLLDTTAGGADREQSYTYCTGQFAPGREVDVALRSD
jgi:spectinomycin phosphotransferase